MNNNQIRETIRFNYNNPSERKMVEYLNKVIGKRKGAFIKEALEMYIEAIEQGVYECPFLKEEEVVIPESKFKNIVKENISPKKEEDLFDFKIDENIFDDVLDNIKLDLQ